MSQVERSLANLQDIHPFFGMSFLAFKKAMLPVGKTEPIIFSRLAVEILVAHYKPSSSYNGFYNPFLSSRPNEKWVKPRYYDTSMQRWTNDTFGDTVIHKKGTPNWGWRSEYIEKLESHLNGKLIPAFDLAVWMYRNDELTTQGQQEIVDRLLTEFLISKEEKVLFDLSLPPIPSGWLKNSALTQSELLDIIGSPPGALPDEGAALRLLELYEVGPAKQFVYCPADRLNIITGDNSLGKTFLLECVWWALTGEWLDQPAYPRREASKNAPKIVFKIGASSKQIKSNTVKYDWDRRAWTKLPKRDALPGLVVYARYDGSFAIWDPARLPSPLTNSPAVFMSLSKVWEGFSEESNGGKSNWICNGLLRDWVNWRNAGSRYEEQYHALISCLEGLSPQGVERLSPGEPVRVSGDSRDVPTLLMPYGAVPILQASAGVQRIIALAYILVWSWFEHVSNSQIAKREPQKSLVLIVDEVEAHLHPRWQRVIVPALMNTVSELTKDVSPQIHLATHSPLVVTSSELVFDKKTDDLLHLKLDDSRSEVLLENVPFVKHGKPDLWLTSDVFGFCQPRSLPAEEAIEAAKAVQMAEEASPNQVAVVHSELQRYLTSDDDFWPRWLYFARKHGVQQ